MSEDYWDGALWVYHGDITNGGAGAGQQIYVVQPGVGNELEVLYGELFMGDTVSRAITVTIEDALGQELTRLLSLTANAASFHCFPAADPPTVGDTQASAGTRFIVAGAMEFRGLATPVAVSQDTAFAVACRIRGGIPSVTEIGQDTPTVNINREEVV